jgi:hypothetical protein
MLEYVKKERIPHMIFGWVDRVARNLYDYTQLCKKLEKSNPGLHLHIINESLAFSPFLKEDYQDQERCEALLVKGKAASGLTSHRVTKAKADKFEEGRYTYQLPYGYRSLANPETRRPYAVLVPERAKKAKEIFRMMASGKYSLLSLAKSLEKKGWTKPSHSRVLGKAVEVPFTRSYLYYMLWNETYLGKVKYRGLTKASSVVPPIVDQSTFDKVQSVLNSQCKFRRSEDKAGKYRSPLAHLCRCHYCGCQITTDFTENKYGSKYVYLRCTSGRRLKDINWYKKRFGKTTCIQPYNTEPELIAALDAEIENLHMDEYFVAWLGGELKAAKESSESIGVQVKRNLGERLRKVQERKKQLNIMRADGEISKEEFLEAKAETLKEEEALARQIQESAGDFGNVEDEIEITLDLMARLREKWVDFGIGEKAEALRIMTKKIVLGEHGKNRPAVEWEEPWAMLIELGKRARGGIPIEIDWRGRRDLNSRPLA